MRRAPESFPISFTDRFLRGVCEAFRRRTKALGHQGKLGWDTQDDDFEWITITFRSHGPTPVVILQLWEGNMASLFVRSNRRIDRGKVLIRMENLVVVDNAPRLVETFEKTVAQLHGPQETEPQRLTEVAALWQRIRLAKLD